MMSVLNAIGGGYDRLRELAEADKAGRLVVLPAKTVYELAWDAGPNCDGNCRACWVDDMCGEVIDAPAVDVAPVVHGRWAHLGGDEWCCSACGFVITTEGSWDKPTKKHCEDCGARMDGDEDGE